MGRGRHPADIQVARGPSNGTTASRSPPATSNALGRLLQGKASEKLRINPRKAWYRNPRRGPPPTAIMRRRFVLKRPQPRLFFALLASGFSPVYPCHVPPGATCASHPIGTGPVQICRIQAERVDQAGAQPRITGNRAGLTSTASSIRSSAMCRPPWLTFVAGKFDITFGGLTVAAYARHRKSVAPGRLRAEPDECQPQP